MAVDRGVREMGTAGCRRRWVAAVLGGLTAVLVSTALIGAAGPAAASDSDEQALAKRFAPVMMLVAQSQACGRGEPYRPSNVERLMDNTSVALRGPWTPQDLVKVGPSAAYLAKGLPGYSLDLPGNPLAAGCSYEMWASSNWRGSPPTIYAHVATQSGYRDRIALQYYFFYPYNDFNNKHEGDWERIQLEFAAPDAAAALDSRPVLVAYSQHYGSENAAWGDGKLRLVGGTHPMVYVAAGSHASYYTSDLFLGRSAAQGFGCDTTLGPHDAVRPVVETIPSDPASARTQFPWIDYEGHWGERGSRAFYDGPTGPNMKSAWTKPFSWSEQGRARSYAIPGGEAYGGPATSFFCSAVSVGSDGLRLLTAKPLPTLAVLALVLLAVVWLVRRTSWEGSAPLPAGGHRSTGQIIAVSWGLLRSRPLLFSGIAAPVAAVLLVSTLLQQVLVAARPDPTPPAWAVVTGYLALLLTLVLAQAATVQAVRELGERHRVSIGRAYRLAFARLGPLLGTLALVAVVLALLGASVVLGVVALVLLWAWCLFVPVVELERRAGFAAVRRSWRLVRRQKVPVLALLLLAALLSALVGGLLGTLVIVAVQAPFWVDNLVPGLASLLLQPFISLLLVYAYHNGRALEESAGSPSDGTDREPVPVRAS